MNKRGLSEVVTTLIIILLVLVAIGSVWVIVSNVLSKGSDSIELGKFTIDVNFLKASLNGSNALLTVKRTSGAGNLTGLKFIISDGFNSEDFDEATNLTELQEKTFIVNLSSLNPDNAKTVSVAPIYSSASGKETIGDVTDTYTFRAGSGSFSGGTGNEGSGGNDNGGNQNASGQCSPACVTGDTCVNGVCVSPTCQPQNQSQTCGSRVCGSKINNCGEAISCGTCSIQQVCNDNIGQCELITPISGKVDTVWPPGISIYFNSPDLPKNNIYSGYYARFLPPSQETQCLQVEDYSLPQPPQTEVVVKLVATHTGIASNDSVQLWPTYESCAA